MRGAARAVRQAGGEAAQPLEVHAGPGHPPFRCAAGAWLSWPWQLELQQQAAWRGSRAGASLAPAVGRPRCSRIARIPPASFTYASTRRLPPHLTQANTSMANV